MFLEAPDGRYHSPLSPTPPAGRPQLPRPVSPHLRRFEKRSVQCCLPPAKRLPLWSGADAHGSSPRLPHSLPSFLVHPLSPSDPARSVPEFDGVQTPSRRRPPSLAAIFAPPSFIRPRSGRAMVARCEAHPNGVAAASGKARRAAASSVGAGRRPPTLPSQNSAALTGLT
jgi:hypothetical protein